MNHIPSLIQDLALILLVAAITTLLFKKLKQPVVLGYILAGFLVSPKFAVFPNITDVEDIKIWADIGVIFLLFNLGLEFSFKKLMRIGGAAAVTAIIEVSGMVVIGFLLGRLLGWTFMDCIFLGGILSISSTTIILRAFEELGVKNRRFANLVFGVLIIEDLVAVLLLVLLTTISVSRAFEGQQMLFSVLKLVFYLLLWFIFGIFFLPSILRKLKLMLNDETMLIVSIALCLLMVLLASKAGFSPALGAFIMGSILAETTKAEQILHLIKPVKDLFGAVFFVSVGMLIDPQVLKTYSLPIVIITVVFVLFKTLNVTLGAFISGQSLKTSMQAGMSQAQIGEFSFIIAALGTTLKVTSDFLYPVAVAISAITSFTTPYMIRSSEPLYRWIDRRLPVGLHKSLNRYSTGAQSASNTSDWKIILKSYFIHISLLSIVILGIIIVVSNTFNLGLVNWHTEGFLGNVLAASICLLLILPFLWSLLVKRFSHDAFTRMWSEKRYRGVLLFLRLFRVALAIVYLDVLLLNFFSYTIAFFGLVIIVLISILFRKNIHALYVKIENRFLENYNDREWQTKAKSRYELAPWDAIISRFMIPASAAIADTPLQELALREKYGVNIAMIKRGAGYTIMAPERQEKLFPGDEIFVIGTDEQLVQFNKYLDATLDKEDAATEEDLVLKKVLLEADSPFINKSIRESNIRILTKGIVVGIEKEHHRILNPESSYVFEQGDKVWIVGNKTSIQQLIENKEATE